MSKLSRAIEPKWLIVVVFFLSGVFLGGVGLYIWSGVSLSSPEYFKIHSTFAGYKYINPLLGIEVSNARSFAVNNSLDIKLQGLFDSAKKSGKITDGSIYFRDLESGYWIGVNEDTPFTQGRILKLPLMIVYYKAAEEDPGILQKQIKNTIVDIKHSNNIFPSTDPIVFGQSYTIEELISRMGINSDDAAAELLFNNIDKKQLQQVYSDLGISFDEQKGVAESVTLKLYSLFFRVLVNSTYLNREYSEKALALLDTLTDEIGVGAYIPKELLFVHRYGGRKLVENEKTLYQVYDCGVTYYPEHPYLLCASAKGSSVDAVEEYLKNLGKEVYSEINFKHSKL